MVASQRIEEVRDGDKGGRERSQVAVTVVWVRNDGCVAEGGDS